VVGYFLSLRSETLRALLTFSSTLGEEDMDTERNNIMESIHKAAGKVIAKRKKKSPKHKFKNLE
jgi:hypothetical protein